MKTTLSVIIIVLLAGCTAGKNTGSIKNDMHTEKQRMLDFSNKIDSTNNERMAKVAAGELDEITDSLTRVYIQRLKDSVNARLSFFNAMATGKKIRKNKAAVLDYLNSAKQQYAKELNNILFLDDLYKTSTFNRLNTAAFFEPGEYMLTDSATAQTAVIMDNIIKDAADFSSRHSSTKLKAMFVVLGYADEQEIGKGSVLYNELIINIGSKTPERKQLNTELSNRRASSIKNILRSRYRLYFPYKEGSLFSSSFVATGKGEILPAGNFANYQPVDERRRVVLLYWSILPDLE